MSEANIRLFPAGIRFVASGEPGEAGILLPDELPFTAGMAPQRLVEFRRGRACARRALAALGVHETAIPVGAGRAPVWPAGITGSITHAGRRAAAAVARQSDYLSIGIDMEARGTLDAGVLAMICSADELRAAMEIFDPDVAARLLFSAKESVFKCLWPLAQAFIDFQEVGITARPATGSWQATLTGVRDDIGPLISGMRGGYELAADHVLTGAWIRSG